MRSLFLFKAFVCFERWIFKSSNFVAQSGACLFFKSQWKHTSQFVSNDEDLKECVNYFFFDYIKNMHKFSKPILCFVDWLKFWLIFNSWHCHFHDSQNLIVQLLYNLGWPRRIGSPSEVRRFDADGNSFVTRFRSDSERESKNFWKFDPL